MESKSQAIAFRVAQEAKRNGAKLICIDPRRTETAEKCHEHVQLRPGTDAALALAKQTSTLDGAVAAITKRIGKPTWDEEDGKKRVWIAGHGAQCHRHRQKLRDAAVVAHPDAGGRRRAAVFARPEEVRHRLRGAELAVR